MLLIYLFACRGEEPTSVPETVDQAPLRRMTERQFNNSIRDIFPETELPYLLLPHTGLEGFYDNDISTVNPNNSTISAFQDIAMQLSISLHEEEYFPACEDTDCTVEILLPLSSQFWRRPLTAEEQTDLEEMYREWSDTSSPDLAVLLGIQYLVQSPDFLYFPEIGIQEGQHRKLTGYEVASRLSYFLWNSMPDQELLEKASDASILQQEILVEQTWRMLSDEKANKGILNFHRQWLHWDSITETVIDFENVQIYEGQEEEGYQNVADGCFHTFAGRAFRSHQPAT